MDESIQVFIEQSKEEQDKVRTLFLEGILGRPKIKDKQQYVKINQCMLIRLLDKLYSYKQEKDLNDKIFNLYDTISYHLENMLDFIEDFFGNYFDRNEKVPTSYLVISVKELCRQLELLTQAVQPYDAYVHAVVNILVNNFNTFCLEKKNGATYNELMYQKDLMNQLLTDKTLASENSIKEVLFYLNYNDDDYIAYLYEKLNALTESFSTKKEKIGALRFEQKNFNQLPTRLICYLSSSMSSLKEQINHWIEEEIKFLESEHTPLTTNQYIQPIEKSEVYVHVPFKGSEIYLLHKSFLDSFLDGLMEVSPAVKKYKRVVDIITSQGMLVKEYKNAFSRFKKSNLFNGKEIDYMSGVYTNLFDKSLQSLDELLMVITANKLRMSDDERFAAIDRIFADMEDKLSFLRNFNRSTTVLAMQRGKETIDTKVSQQLYGVH